ncbi:acetone carboxylase subunit gamma [Variovorax sp. M-6]|uniref:acetone carboxylase subunit gamma n=1 Tax=Variovorax sp. M-6 TaxID=3233041 RepID=UPI003F9BD806
MNRSSYSPTISIAPNGDLQCVRCDHVLASAGTSWKQSVNRVDQPMHSLCEIYDTGSDEVIIRRFYCPSCGTALESETVLVDEATIDDEVHAR